MKGLNGITDSMDLSLSKLQEMVKNRKFWQATVHGIAELDTTERLNQNNMILISSKSWKNPLGIWTIQFITSIMNAK